MLLTRLFPSAVSCQLPDARPTGRYVPAQRGNFISHTEELYSPREKTSPDREPPKHRRA